MTSRVPVRTFKSRPDPIQFVFSCPLCLWQVQGGYAARRDFGPEGLFDVFGRAHMDHIKEEHADGSDVELVMPEGKTHGIARSLKKGGMEGALIATPLPRWWVDR